MAARRRLSHVVREVKRYVMYVEYDLFIGMRLDGRRRSRGGNERVRHSFSNLPTFVFKFTNIRFQIYQHSFSILLSNIFKFVVRCCKFCPQMYLILSIPANIFPKSASIFGGTGEKLYLCIRKWNDLPGLGYGVMVAQDILVVLVLVRNRIAQPSDSPLLIYDIGRGELRLWPPVCACMLFLFTGYHGGGKALWLVDSCLSNRLFMTI